MEQAIDFTRLSAALSLRSIVGEAWGEYWLCLVLGLGWIALVSARAQSESTSGIQLTNTRISDSARVGRWILYLASIPLLLWSAFASCATIQRLFTLGGDVEGFILWDLSQTLGALLVLALFLVFMVVMAMLLAKFHKNPEPRTWLCLPMVLGVATWFVDHLSYYMIMAVVTFYRLSSQGR